MRRISQKIRDISVDQESGQIFLAAVSGLYRTFTDHKDNSVDFFHIDLSNTGEIVNKIMELWDEKIVIGGLILFEGGTVDRDKIKWMVKYDKKPIKPEIETNK